MFRFSRLYPLHLATLIAVAILQSIYFRMHGCFFVYQNNDVGHFLLQLLMASKWGLESGDSFNGPIWSISVEVLVYVAFFLALRYVTRSALFNVVVVVACLHVGGQVFSCLAFFYAGGLAGMARRAAAPATSRDLIECTGWSIAILVPVSIVAFGLQSQLIAWLFVLTYTPVLLFCLSGETMLPAQAQRLIEAAGNMTYSSYLLHFPIQLLMAIGFGFAGRALPFYQGWFFALYVGATLPASYLVYRWFEEPAQRLLRRRLLPRNLPPRLKAADITSSPRREPAAAGMP